MKENIKIGYPRPVFTIRQSGFRDLWCIFMPCLLTCVLLFHPSGVYSVEKKNGENETNPSQATLEATRLTMDKWFEIQQIISKDVIPQDRTTLCLPLAA